MNRFDRMIQGLQQEIEVPEKVWASYAETLSRLPEKKERRHVAASGWAKYAASAAAVVFVGTAVCVANPALAEKIPVIGKIFAEVQDEVLFSGEYSEKAQILATETVMAEIKEKEENVATDAGVSITASEVYSDGISVYLTAEVQVEQGGLLNIPDGTEGSTLYLKGSWNLAGETDQIALVNDNLNGQAEDDQTFMGMVKLDLAGRKLQDGMLELNLTEIGYDDIDELDAEDVFASHRIEGNWNLTVPFTVDAEAAKTIEVNVEKDGYCIEKVVISPYQVLSYTKSSDEDCVTIIYNQDGEQLRPIEESQGCSVNAVQGMEISKLYIYVFDSFEAWCEMEESGMGSEAAEKAVVYAEVEV